MTLMADASAHRDPGLFTILVRVRNPVDLFPVRRRIAEALGNAAVVPIEPSRLEAIKSHLRYSFAASLRSPDAVARTVGESIAATGRPDAVNDLYAAYGRLAPEDLKRVAALLRFQQRDGDHPRDGEEEMNRIHRLAAVLLLRLLDASHRALFCGRLNPQRLRARKTARS